MTTNTNHSSGEHTHVTIHHIADLATLIINIEDAICQITRIVITTNGDGTKDIHGLCSDVGGRLISYLATGPDLNFGHHANQYFHSQNGNRVSFIPSIITWNIIESRH